jgi:uncharacterized membrane protein YfcA
LHLTGPDFAAAAAASIVAGAVNALAGGGTLISFPTLVGLGVPAVEANVTNTVSLLPGYLAGSLAQRKDLQPQVVHSRWLAAVGGLGGLGGSVLLVTIPGHAFRAAVPYLIVLSCALLLFQDRIRSLVFGGPQSDAIDEAQRARQHVVPRTALVFLSAVYGGFFGAGLGIMLLAVLGLFSNDPLSKVNALKQALSFLINLVAAVFFAFSGHVLWAAVPVMAIGSMVGGLVGGRLVPVIREPMLRYSVILAGVAVAISFWVA